MDKKIKLIGLGLTLLSTFLFAVFMLFGLTMCSYFVCIFLAIGYLMLVSGTISEEENNNKSLKYLALAFGVVYAILIFIVYFTQVTVVNKGNVSSDALYVLDYRNLNLMFYLDLLGYGFMGLSTLFLGLSLVSTNKLDKTYKILLMCHGLFFLPCLIMPITPIFDKSGASSSNTLSGGVIALEIWCIYFLAICVIGIIGLLKKNKTSTITE